MNAFAEARLDMAVVRIDCVLSTLRDDVERALLLRARGDIVAARQLLELEASLDTAADTERPSHLRVVR